MVLRKVVVLEGHVVWARVYRDASLVTFKTFSCVFIAAWFPWLEGKAIRRCYKKAHEWADMLVDIENSVKHD